MEELEIEQIIDITLNELGEIEFNGSESDLNNKINEKEDATPAILTNLVCN